MKIIISHPTGNANVKFLLKGLSDNQLLSEFHTSVATFPDNIWDKLSKVNAFSDFKRRSFSADLKPYTKTHAFKEISRIAAIKLKLSLLTKHEKGILSIDKIYNYIDEQSAKKLAGDTDAVYAYEDGAMNTFLKAKRMGIKCLYDLPIGYWRSAREFLKTEMQNRSDWACTLTGFNDSIKKLERKDKELGLADHIFVASSFTKKTLSLYPNSIAPISVVPYGFPNVSSIREYSPINNRPLKLLFVGSLSQRKGIANIFEAMEQFGNNVQLTVVGQKVVDNCKPLNEGLKKHTWIPSLPHNEILALMQKHDVLVFPSLFEGFGLVITEAMSQGVPVITTERTAGGDFIIHGKNGWLIEPGSTHELVVTIQDILQNNDALFAIGKAAQDTAKSRPWGLYSSEMAASIRSILTV